MVYNIFMYGCSCYSYQCKR